MELLGGEVQVIYNIIDYRMRYYSIDFLKIYCNSRFIFYVIIKFFDFYYIVLIIVIYNVSVEYF